MKYLVREYLPNFFSGFDLHAYRGIEHAEITSMPFCDSWRNGADFDKFVIEPYGPELMISAYLTTGKHYVVGFALPEDSEAVAPDGGLLRDNWRYKDHEH